MHFVPTSLATSIVYHVFCLHQHCDSPQTTAVQFQLHLATVRWFTKAKYSASSLSTVQLHPSFLHQHFITPLTNTRLHRSQFWRQSKLPSQIPRFSASTLRCPTKAKASASWISIVQRHKSCIQFLCINTVMVNWSQIQCIDTEQMHPAFLHQHSNPLSNVQAATTHWVGNWCGLINILVLDKVGVQKSNEIVDFFVDGFPTDTGALPRLWWVP